MLFGERKRVVQTFDDSINVYAAYALYARADGVTQGREPAKYDLVAALRSRYERRRLRDVLKRRKRRTTFAAREREQADESERAHKEIVTSENLEAVRAIY